MTSQQPPDARHPRERNHARFVNIDDGGEIPGVSRGHAYKQAHR